MGHYNGRLVEILLEPYQNAAARIACTAEALPKPGQYLQAYNPDDPLEVVPISLFVAGEAHTSHHDEVSFPVAGPLPAAWQPGTQLNLRGPLGRGFALPPHAKRLVLAALGASPARLLSLLPSALSRGVEVALFCDSAMGELPTSVEIRKLDALPAALAWADYLAVDVALEQVGDLAALLGLKENLPRALAAQALVAAPMPCGGLAKCGVCSVSTRNGSKLACEDGPIFDLSELIQKI
jgi:NAD(P)H-flavin reductase